MGEIHAEVTLENTGDRAHVDRGDREETEVRRTTVDGIVDTGAVSLLLPQNVVERLGLQQRGTAFVAYADERRDERPLAGPVTVRIGNREMTTNCVVGPPLSEVLIGQVVLEMLDLIADCTNRTRHAVSHARSAGSATYADDQRTSGTLRGVRRHRSAGARSRGAARGDG